MNNTRSHSCFRRPLHFHCDPFRLTSSTSVVQLILIKFHHWPNAMMKTQFFKKKWLNDFEQVTGLTGCVCHSTKLHTHITHHTSHITHYTTLD